MTAPSSGNLERSSDAGPDGTWPNVDELERGTVGWRLLRGLLLITGTVVLGMGLLIVLVPGTEELFPIERAIRALGSDYLVVAVVGVSTVGLSMLVVAARHLRGIEESNPPVVEGVQSATYPGARFERSTSRHGSGAGSSTGDARQRLREAATRATMRADGCSRDVAEERVRTGDWTDDPVAGRYLSDPSATGENAGSPRRGRSIRGGAESIGRTVDAIERISDGGGERSGNERDSRPVEGET